MRALYVFVPMVSVALVTTSALTDLVGWLGAAILSSMFCLTDAGARAAEPGEGQRYFFH